MLAVAGFTRERIALVADTPLGRRLATQIAVTNVFTCMAILRWSQQPIC